MASDGGISDDEEWGDVDPVVVGYLHMKRPARPSGGIFPRPHIEPGPNPCGRICAPVSTITVPRIVLACPFLSAALRMWRALKRKSLVAKKIFLVARPAKVPHAVIERRNLDWYSSLRQQILPLSLCSRPLL